jgi:transposase
MHITTIGLDLAKRWFQIHGVDAAGKVVVRRRLRRTEVVAFFRKQKPCLVAWRPARRRTIGRGN